VIPLVALLLCSCAEEDLRFTSPAATFATYREALTGGDVQTSWLCLSTGYRHLEYNDDTGRWTSHVSLNGGALSRDVNRLDISQEMEINDRLGFLQFEPSTVGSGQSPFFYFLREPGGWKITSHLDSLFRVELETAIERGEFTLPVLGR